ncbi:hypothetical protein C0993_007393 [Termitomyces sp. T159_Od127]|nr:hypothetical protein C0993_007393 [Termitomyces sp. T159_Od127]
MPLATGPSRPPTVREIPPFPSPTLASYRCPPPASTLTTSATSPLSTFSRPPTFVWVLRQSLKAGLEGLIGGPTTQAITTAFQAHYDHLQHRPDFNDIFQVYLACDFYMRHAYLQSQGNYAKERELGHPSDPYPPHFIQAIFGHFRTAPLNVIEKAPAPGIQESVADTIVHIFLTKGIEAVIKWVDEFIFLRYPHHKPDGLLHYKYDSDLIWNVANELGWPWAADKSKPSIPSPTSARMEPFFKICLTP